MRKLVALMAVVGACATGPSDSGPPDAGTPNTGPVDAGSPALVCSASQSAQVAFVFHESGGFFSNFLPHGSQLLVIDGSCRYHVYSLADEAAGALRTGVLTADEVWALNAELLTVPWKSLDGASVNQAQDAPILEFRRDGFQARCVGTCQDADAGLLEALQKRAEDWLQRLWDRGVAPEGGVEIRGGVARSSDAGVPDGGTWTGRGDLDTLIRVGRITDTDDVELIRRLRAIHGQADFGPPMLLEQHGKVYAVGAVDVLPFSLKLFRHYGDAWTWRPCAPFVWPPRCR